MIEFSELAISGLEECTENRDRAAALRHSIALHLSHPEAIDKSIRLAEPPDRAVYMFALGTGGSLGSRASMGGWCGV